MTGLERAGWLAFGLFLAGAGGLIHFGGPEWAANLLIALTFLVSIPLALLAIRAQWRGR
jgi:hypothetical protein